MDDKEFITSIRDQCNAHLAGASGGGGGGGPVPAINVKPSVYASLGMGYDAPVEKVVAPYEVVGYSLHFRSTGDGGRPVTDRSLHWFGKPGDIFNYTSWAIFDSVGSRVMGQDNYLPAGTLGMKVEHAQLAAFGDGDYVLAIAIDGPAGNLAVQFNQQP